MSTVWFTSDPHIGHKNIATWRKNISSCEHNTEWFFECWRASVGKNDLVYVLGDSIFDRELFPRFAELPGRKILIRGNHDKGPASELLTVFEDVKALVPYKKFWLSHAPIHPQELRGKINVHGHVHYKTVPDYRYINVCCDNLWETEGRALITLQRLLEIFEKRIAGKCRACTGTGEHGDGHGRVCEKCNGTGKRAAAE